ncbi:MAG: hypothetical protein GY943_27820 [Chloroflexi bacterium]|nr:hypothetical protein [Chloroflexota bacterium]
MEQVYVFILDNDVWIYIVCALGLFWYFSELLRARKILRRAMFGLERENGARIRNSALIFILIFLGVASSVYYVNVEIADELPAELRNPPTSTPDIFRTPLASPTPLSSPIPSPTPPLVPTITLPSQVNEAPIVDATPQAIPEDTPTPEATITPFTACTLDLNISEPREGATISGAITFIGTADIQGFAGYKLEANGPQTDGQWASLLGRTIDQPVRESIMGNVNLNQWTPGPYLIRLVALNSQQSEIGVCVTQITLSN